MLIVDIYIDHILTKIQISFKKRFNRDIDKLSIIYAINAYYHCIWYNIPKLRTFRIKHIGIFKLNDYKAKLSTEEFRDRSEELDRFKRAEVKKRGVLRKMKFGRSTK